MVDYQLDQQDIYGVTLRLHKALKDAGFTEEPAIRQSLALAEEVGEFVGAVRRWRGMARRTDTFEHVSEELADVVITAWVTAHAMNIDLIEEIDKKLSIIFSRGWHSDD